MKKDSGITLITLVFTIMLMLIIITTLVYNYADVGKAEALTDMYADIKLLTDRISIYYFDNNSIPTGSKIENVSQDIKSINPNDNANYYEIDLTKLEDVELNYGNKIDEQDIYIINEKSHTVYYLKGINLKNTIYYTLERKLC